MRGFVQAGSMEGSCYDEQRMGGRQGSIPDVK